jgi:hypothetical protein
MKLSTQVLPFLFISLFCSSFTVLGFFFISSKLLTTSVSRFRAVSSPSRPLSASMSSIRAEIEQDIKQNKVMVFSKSYCPYCTEAKTAISKLGVAFKAIELDVRVHFY